MKAYAILRDKDSHLGWVRYSDSVEELIEYRESLVKQWLEWDRERGIYTKTSDVYRGRLDLVQMDTKTIIPWPGQTLTRHLLKVYVSDLSRGRCTSQMYIGNLCTDCYSTTEGSHEQRGAESHRRITYGWRHAIRETYNASEGATECRICGWEEQT